MTTTMSRRRRVALTALAGGLVTVLAGPSVAEAQDQGTRLYVPKPNHGAIEQIADLRSQGAKDDAALIRAMIETPQAVWFEGVEP